MAALLRHAGSCRRVSAAGVGGARSRTGHPRAVCRCCGIGPRLSRTSPALPPSRGGPARGPVPPHDMPQAVARLRQALARAEKILVFGDYDVDGLTAAALWTACCAIWGRCHHDGAEPDGGRFRPLSRAVEEAAAAGVSLLVASDCGTTAHAAVARARDLGIDVVVADHHVPQGNCRPLTPWSIPAGGRLLPVPDLAAVGVSFKILQGLIRDLGGAGTTRSSWSTATSWLSAPSPTWFLCGERTACWSTWAWSSCGSPRGRVCSRSWKRRS